MSNRKLEQALMGRLPVYTLAGLFESGALGLEDEAALEEIRATRQAVHQLVNPAHGWMSPRQGGNGVQPTPRALGWPGPWQRYSGWHQRWQAPGRLALSPCPSDPWGLSWPAVVIELICEPTTFADMATRLGLAPIDVVYRFIDCVRDYGRPDAYGVTHMSWPVAIARRSKVVRDNTKRPQKARKRPS